MRRFTREEVAEAELWLVIYALITLFWASLVLAGVTFGVL